MLFLNNIVVMLVSGIKENLCWGNTLYAFRAKEKNEESAKWIWHSHCSIFKSVNMKSNGHKVTCWETQIVFKWASLEPSIITETTENLFPIGKFTKKIHIFNHKHKHEFHFWLIFVHMIACLLVWSTREGGHPIILPNHPSVGALSDELHIYHMGPQNTPR